MFKRSLNKLISFQNNSSIIFPSETIIPNFIKTITIKSEHSDKLSNSFSLIENEEIKKLISITSLYLKNHNIKENEGIVILSENNFWEVILIFSLWNIGAFPIPLNTRLLNSELESIINFINPENIIINSELSESNFSLNNFNQNNFSKKINPIFFSVNDLIKYLEHSNFIFNDKKKIVNLNNNKIDEEIYSIDEHLLEQTAVMIFTSGTTSLSQGKSNKPKGVVLSFRNLISSAFLGNDIFHFTNQDKWLLSLPLYHIGGFSILVRALLFDSNIIIPQSLKIENLVSAIEKVNPTLVSFVPTQLKRILEIEKIKKENDNTSKRLSENIRAVILSGGPSEISLIKNAIKNGWKIYKGYGSSETSAFLTLLPFEDISNPSTSSGKEKINSVGKPLSHSELNLNVDIKIISTNIDNLINTNDEKIIINNDSENNLQKGEIIISSPTLTKGYFNNPEETNKKFINGYFYTGDYGYFDEDGYLYIETRRTDLIISGGENINPFEVEEKLLQHPQIKECCVFGLKDEEWGEILSVVLVTKQNKEISYSEIKDFLSNKIASYKIPKKIFYTKEIPKTSLGKIKRAEIKSYFNSLS
ncbi:MAG: hypothetical protein STSR0008_05070 [Ignavibacterium sp.]